MTRGVRVQQDFRRQNTQHLRLAAAAGALPLPSPSRSSSTSSTPASSSRRGEHYPSSASPHKRTPAQPTIGSANRSHRSGGLRSQYLRPAHSSTSTPQSHSRTRRPPNVGSGAIVPKSTSKSTAIVPNDTASESAESQALALREPSGRAVYQRMDLQLRACVFCCCCCCCCCCCRCGHLRTTCRLKECRKRCVFI